MKNVIGVLIKLRLINIDRICFLCKYLCWNFVNFIFNK